MSNPLLDLVNQTRNRLKGGNKNRPERLQSERNLVRLLPGWDPKDPIFFQYWGQHWIKDTAGNVKAVYVCTQHCFGEQCDVCEAIAAGAAMTSDEDILETLKKARNSNRILVNALYLKGGKHDNPETNPVVLELPPSVLDAMLAVIAEYDEEDIKVLDLKQGLNFIVEKTGSGMNTEYKVTPAPKASAVPDGVMDKVQNLAAWARQESEAEKAKAVTSVRMISGMGSAGSTTARPRIGVDTEAKTSRLADVEAVDADFVDIGGDSDDIDDFISKL